MTPDLLQVGWGLCWSERVGGNGWVRQAQFWDMRHQAEAEERRRQLLRRNEVMRESARPVWHQDITNVFRVLRGPDV